MFDLLDELAGTIMIYLLLWTYTMWKSRGQKRKKLRSIFEDILIQSNVIMAFCHIDCGPYQQSFGQFYTNATHMLTCIHLLYVQFEYFIGQSVNVWELILTEGLIACMLTLFLLVIKLSMSLDSNLYIVFHSILSVVAFLIFLIEFPPQLMRRLRGSETRTHSSNNSTPERIQELLFERAVWNTKLQMLELSSSSSIDERVSYPQSVDALLQSIPENLNSQKYLIQTKLEEINSTIYTISSLLESKDKKFTRDILYKLCIVTGCFSYVSILLITLPLVALIISRICVILMIISTYETNNVSQLIVWSYSPIWLSYLRVISAPLGLLASFFSVLEFE